MICRPKARFCKADLRTEGLVADQSCGPKARLRTKLAGRRPVMGAEGPVCGPYLRTEGPVCGPDLRTEGPICGPNLRTEGPICGPDLWTDLFA